MAPAGIAMLMKSMGIDVEEITRVAMDFQKGLQQFNAKLDLVIAQQGALQQQINMLQRAHVMDRLPAPAEGEEAPANGEAIQ